MIRFLTLATVMVTMTAGLRAQTPATPSRIAVIGTSETTDVAALVTTELSTNPNISLVERDDLAKVGDELKLQQMADADTIALGKLTGADGLLFLDKRTDGLHVRFTAVNLGYALFDDQVPATIDPVQEAKAVAHLVSNEASKLRLDPTKAVALSVLNLRADFGTDDSAKLERDLTLLLESRLASVPEYVVLERRHAWSLGFEHALDPAAQPLLRGAYLIDGSFSTAASGDCTVAMRIRNPDGHETTFTAPGQTDHLTDLAGLLLAGIQKNIGATTTATAADSHQEAQEYLHEGIWGRHAHAFDAAIEALDSAELLGAPIADVEVERIPVLYAMADQGLENWYNMPSGDEQVPAVDSTTLDRKADTAIRVMREAARYESEKMEAQVDPALLTDPTEKYLARTGNLQAWAVYRASKVLDLLDRVNSPRGDELRQAMRAVTDYDPLHGHAGRSFPTNVNNDIARAQFADDWAQTLDEEKAYYRLVSTDAIMAPPPYGPWIDAHFGARFLKTPEERHQAFADFVESLKDAPDCRITYCLLRTRSDDRATADAGYQDFLDELWTMRDDLASANKDRPLFHNLYPIPDDVKVRNAVTGLPLLHYILTSPKIDSWSIGVLRMLWQPRGFPPADAPQLWSEYKDCRERLGAKWRAEGHGQGAWDEQMGGMADDFKNQFPKLAEEPAAPELPIPDALMVTKFWHPEQTADTTKFNFMIGSLSPCADGLWIKGFFTHDECPLAVFHVNLNNFSTLVIPPPPFKRSPSEIVCTSRAVYLRSEPGDDNGRNSLARYDLKTSSWDIRRLPDFRDARMYEANDQLYLFVTSGGSPSERETSIVRYDWDSDKWDLLASNRRRPAHNQFDDAPPIIFFDGIMTGPNHQACLDIMNGTYFIREDDGAWPQVFDGTFSNNAHTIGDRTLLCSSNGEAVLLDADAAAPEYWVANNTPHARKPAANGKPEKVPTPWAAQANWTIPSNRQPWQIGVGFHDETLFILEEIKPDQPVTLLCYHKGSNVPQRIPLQFKMDAATRAALPFVPDTGSDLVRLSIDQLEHPEKEAMQRMHLYPQLISTHQGLCLQYTFNGFWFIPFIDIDAYLKSAQK